MANSKKSEPGLSELDRRFVDILMADPAHSQTAAYLKLHPKAKKISAPGGANKIMAKPAVIAYYEEQCRLRSERTKIDADWLLRRLVDEADADIADIYTETGAIKPVREWPEIWRKGLVCGMDVKQDFIYEDGQRVPDGVTVKLKLSDRVQRLKLIGDHIGVQAFKQKVDLGVQEDNPIADLIRAVTGKTLEPGK